MSQYVEVVCDESWQEKQTPNTHPASRYPIHPLVRFSNGKLVYIQIPRAIGEPTGERAGSTGR